MLRGSAHSPPHKTGSEGLSPRSEIEFKRPGAAMLMMEIPVRLGYGRGLQHPVWPPLSFQLWAYRQYLRRYPSVINAVAETALAVRAASETVGENRVNPELRPLTGSEDFSFMLKEVPGAYILIGNGRDDAYCANVHTPNYDFNDSILATGSAYWVNLVKVANS